jgi:hypothetical protein
MDAKDCEDSTIPIDDVRIEIGQARCRGLSEGTSLSTVTRESTRSVVSILKAVKRRNDICQVDVFFTQHYRHVVEIIRRRGGKVYLAANHRIQSANFVTQLLGSLDEFIEDTFDRY